MRRFAFVALALLAAGTARADFISVNVASFSAGPFVNIYGTFNFTLRGTGKIIGLDDGVPTSTFLDDLAEATKVATLPSSDTTTVFTGTARTVVFVQDASSPSLESATATFDIPYMLTTSPDSFDVSFGPAGVQTVMLGSKALKIDLTSGGVGSLRTATFTLNPSAAVPEPSSIVLCGVAGVVGLLAARARRATNVA